MDDNKRPDILYKYRTFNARNIDAIAKGEGYYAPFNTLNDPFEERNPVINDLDDNRDELEALYIHLRAQFETHKLLGGAVFFRHAPDIFEKMKEIIKMNLDFSKEMGMHDTCSIDYLKNAIMSLIVAPRHGVFSLSASCTSSTMWSHYADSHTGFCVGYGSYLINGLNNFRKVVYKRKSPIYLSKLLKERYEQEGIVEHMYVKSSAWKYEKEFRYFGAAGQQRLFLPIVEVIFGLQCPDSHKLAIHAVVENGKKYEGTSKAVLYKKVAVSKKTQRLLIVKDSLFQD